MAPNIFYANLLFTIPMACTGAVSTVVLYKATFQLQDRNMNRLEVGTNHNRIQAETANRLWLRIRIGNIRYIYMYIQHWSVSVMKKGTIGKGNKLREAGNRLWPGLVARHALLQPHLCVRRAYTKERKGMNG